MSEHAQPAGAGTEAIRIVLVDDHTVMRAGTRRILEDEADFRVVGEAADGEEALRLARTHTPDVVVLDIALPGMDGVKVCQVLRAEYPGMRVLILTGHDNAALVRTLHAFGAAGYLLKSAAPHELVASIRDVHSGRPAYGEHARSVLAELAPGDPQHPTRKEIEVLRLVASGKKNREVAEELHLSVNTVEYHLRNLFTKLGASSRADALMRAQRSGWLDSRDALC